MKSRKNTLMGTVAAGIVSLGLLATAQQGHAALVGQWTFNEGSGTTALDSSGNNYNGTISNSTYTASPGDYALAFNGSNSSVNMGTGPTTAITSNKVSLMTWVNVDSTFASLTEPSIGQASVAYWGMTFYGGSVYAYFGGGGSVNLESPLSTNTWHQIAMTYDSTVGGNNSFLYIDGAQVGARNSTGFYNGLAFTVGMDDTGGGASFLGNIDEVRLYDHALSGADVLSAYNIGPVVPEPQTWALLVLGAASYLVFVRRRRV